MDKRNTVMMEMGGTCAGISEQMLLDAFLCEIVVIDAEKRIVKANQAYCRARGRSPEEIIGTDIETYGNASTIRKALEYPTETKLIFQEDDDIVALSSIFSAGRLVGAFVFCALGGVLGIEAVSWLAFILVLLIRFAAIHWNWSLYHPRPPKRHHEDKEDKEEPLE